MKWLIGVIALAGCAAAFASQRPSLGEPPARPELFAPGVINTDGDEYGPTISPDGREFYFSRRTDRRGRERLMVARITAAGVQAPSQLLAEDQWGEKEPYPSLDGRRLFFASRRPPAGGTQASNYDIWVLERSGTAWGAPRHLGAPPNSSTYDNYPAVARNGNLYFSSHRVSGANDLFVSRFSNGRYQEPEAISAVNTAATDADPYIAPDESYMIFSSDRPGTRGEGDLYISFRQRGGWSEPRTLGDLINTTEYEYTPFISPDGKALFFSRGWGDIYWVATKSLNLRP
jgi:Tol biopolymer transport system component